MFKTPVIVTPSWSPETLVSTRSAISLTNWYLKHGIPPLILNGISTLRPIFTRVLDHIRKREESPHLLIYFGHGLNDSLIGIEPIGMRVKSLRPVVAGQNSEVLKDFITYAVACNSLSKLGYEAIENGATTYYSNMDPLHILTTDLNNNGLDIFTELFTTIPISLAQGKTTEQSYTDFQNTALKLQQIAKEGSYEYIMIEQIRKSFDIIGQNVTWL